MTLDETYKVSTLLMYSATYLTSFKQVRGKEVSISLARENLHG